MALPITPPTGAALLQAPGAAPLALHRGEDALPFVSMGEDRRLQVLQVDLALGVWIVRDQFAPGATVQTHRHTGPVYAFTQTGSWHYREYPEVVNTAGSFLFEPAGSQHTLTVPNTNVGVTDVWFAITGSLLNLDAANQVESVSDAASVLAAYRSACLAQHGMMDPPVLVFNEHR